jgi:hypothetical protein
MQDATRATLHIPIPIKNEMESDTVSSGEYLYIPDKPKVWLTRLLKNAIGNEELFFTITNLTDCPDTFWLTLSSFPDDQALNGMEKGTDFGIYTNAAVIRAMRDAFNFMLGEVERNQENDC